jgi:hypothetical protein
VRPVAQYVQYNVLNAAYTTSKGSFKEEVCTVSVGVLQAILAEEIKVILHFHFEPGIKGTG